MLAKLVLNSAAFQIQLLLSPQLTSGSSFKYSWEHFSSARADCHCSGKVTAKGLWWWLEPIACITQWQACWVLHVALKGVWCCKGTGRCSWVGCHDNCAAAECPPCVFPQRAEVHCYSLRFSQHCRLRRPFPVVLPMFTVISVGKMCKWCWQVSGKTKSWSP